MHSLSSLPRELLLQIVSYFPSSVVVLDLWKSGDGIIRRKLEAVVVSIDLKRGSRSCRWPNCLSRFSRLRRLSIDVSFAAPLLLQQALLSLPIELEELTLSSPTSLHSSDGPNVDISEALNFSHLRKLSMNHLLTAKRSPFLRFLMRNVNELYVAPEFSTYELEQDGITFGDPRILQNMTLPPKLEKLGFGAINFDLFPKPACYTIDSITFLRTAASDCDLMPFLPVELILPHHTWTPEHATICPPTVTSLLIGPVSGFGNLNWTASLPPNLTSLDCMRLHQNEAAALPRTLTHLRLRRLCLGWSKSQPSGLPNLRSVHLSEEGFDDFVKMLPLSVTILKMRHISTRYEVSCDLPLSITELHVESKAVRLELPPGLQKLTLPRFLKNKSAVLPETLTHLVCEASFVRRDLNLIHSHHLRSLEILHCSDDLFAFLPRSLTSLTINELITKSVSVNGQAQKWSQLPMGLQSISLISYTSRVRPLPLQCLEPLVELQTIYWNAEVTGDYCAWLHNNLFELRSFEFYSALKTSDGLPPWFYLIESKTESWHTIRRF